MIWAGLLSQGSANHTGVDLNFGLMLQIIRGSRLVSGKIAGIFKPGASYHKPDMTCPSAFKRMAGRKSMPGGCHRP